MGTLSTRPVRVLVAGTFDPDFHRNRILLGLLRETGLEISICHVRLWGRRAEHVVLRGKLRTVLAALRAYPRLAWRLLRAPEADVILVPYPGHFDLPLVKLFAKWRGAPVLFDKFISLFDTIVTDRRLCSPRSLTGRAARATDRMACRLSDRILADTPPHAEFFAHHAGVHLERLRVLWVGAEEQVFHPHPEQVARPERVLFYGTFIPLHGIETIVEAASILRPRSLTFRIIGMGQEYQRIRDLAADIGADNIEWVDEVPLAQLPLEIASAALCLGIFGTTEKASRVVPNKVFQCLAVGRPVLSGDTPALRAAFTEEEVAGCPPGDPVALAETIERLIRDPAQREALARAGHQRYQNSYSLQALSQLLRIHLEDLVQWRQKDH